MSDCLTRAEVKAMLDEQRATMLRQLCEILGRVDAERAINSRAEVRDLDEQLDSCPHISQARQRDAALERASAAEPSRSARSSHLTVV